MHCANACGSATFNPARRQPPCTPAADRRSLDGKLFNCYLVDYFWGPLYCRKPPNALPFNSGSFRAEDSVGFGSAKSSETRRRVVLCLLSERERRGIDLIAVVFLVHRQFILVPPPDSSLAHSSHGKLPLDLIETTSRPVIQDRVLQPVLSTLLHKLNIIRRWRVASQRQDHLGPAAAGHAKGLFRIGARLTLNSWQKLPCLSWRTTYQSHFKPQTAPATHCRPLLKSQAVCSEQCQLRRVDAAYPFRPSQLTACTLACLLHRTGQVKFSWAEEVREAAKESTDETC